VTQTGWAATGNLPARATLALFRPGVARIVQIGFLSNYLFYFNYKKFFVREKSVARFIWAAHYPNKHPGVFIFPCERFSRSNLSLGSAKRLELPGLSRTADKFGL